MEQKSFDYIKHIVNNNTLWSHPDFNKNFDIHTDSSDFQLGVVISQEGKQITSYIHKLKDPQTRYTITEKDLLSIVETLKEFQIILLGQQLKIYTNHKNMMYNNFNTDWVLRWRLILKNKEWISST